jgi:transcriptional regulator with XRE-family HTH domain
MNRNEITIENLKELRKKKDYSLIGMAKKVNKSKSAYARIESSEKELTLNEAEAIATNLGTDFNTLTSAGIIFNNESNTVIGQGPNTTINIKLDDKQMQELLDALKK